MAIAVYVFSLSRVAALMLAFCLRLCGEIALGVVTASTTLLLIDKELRAMTFEFLKKAAFLYFTPLAIRELISMV